MPRDRPLVVLRPAPARADTIFDAALPEVFAVVGQPDMPAERLLRAPKLRALLNVEGDFFPHRRPPADVRPRDPGPRVRTGST